MSSTTSSGRVDVDVASDDNLDAITREGVYEDSGTEDSGQNGSNNEDSAEDSAGEGSSEGEDAPDEAGSTIVASVRAMASASVSALKKVARVLEKRDEASKTTRRKKRLKEGKRDGIYYRRTEAQIRLEEEGVTTDSTLRGVQATGWTTSSYKAFGAVPPLPDDYASEFNIARPFREMDPNAPFLEPLVQELGLELWTDSKATFEAQGRIFPRTATLTGHSTAMVESGRVLADPGRRLKHPVSQCNFAVRLGLPASRIERVQSAYNMIGRRSSNLEHALQAYYEAAAPLALLGYTPHRIFHSLTAHVHLCRVMADELAYAENRFRSALTVAQVPNLRASSTTTSALSFDDSAFAAAAESLAKTSSSKMAGKKHKLPYQGGGKKKVKFADPPVQMQTPSHAQGNHMGSFFRGRGRGRGGPWRGADNNLRGGRGGRGRGQSSQRGRGRGGRY